MHRLTASSLQELHACQPSSSACWGWLVPGRCVRMCALIASCLSAKTNTFNLECLVVYLSMECCVSAHHVMCTLSALQVRSLARQLMKRYHGAASCTDDGSEHPHRVSLQIRSDVLDDFVHRWSSGLVEAGVQVRRGAHDTLIACKCCSGGGQHLRLSQPRLPCIYIATQHRSWECADRHLLVEQCRRVPRGRHVMLVTDHNMLLHMAGFCDFAASNGGQHWW
jgi:hypothetical protein